MGIVDEQIGGDLHENGTPQDHARVERLTRLIAAEFDAERPTTVRAAVAWAAESGLRAQATRVEVVLATSWDSSAQEGFFALLSALGIARADVVITV
jgi:hypothetical protein